MIERFTIKFGPAVSLKELEKALHESDHTLLGFPVANLHKVKARIDVIGEFEDLKKLKGLLESLTSREPCQ